MRPFLACAFAMLAMSIGAVAQPIIPYTPYTFKFMTNKTAASARGYLGVGTGVGDVVGPASSTAGAIPLWADGTGNLLVDSIFFPESFQPASANLTNWGAITTASKQAAFTTSTGVTNIANVLSAAILPGANVTFTTNAAGEITIAGSSGGVANTVVGGITNHPAGEIAVWNGTETNLIGSGLTVPMLGNYINIMSYGAVGDGTANDTGPLTNAIIAASAANATVFLPHGTYSIGDAVLTDLVSVRLYGPEATIKNRPRVEKRNWHPYAITMNNMEDIILYSPTNVVASGAIVAEHGYVVRTANVTYNGTVYAAASNSYFTGVNGVTTYTGAGIVVEDLGWVPGLHTLNNYVHITMAGWNVDPTEEAKDTWNAETQIANNVDYLAGAISSKGSPLYETLNIAVGANAHTFYSFAHTNGNNATLTTADAHGFSFGDTVVLTQMGPYSGSYTIVSTPTTTNFTFTPTQLLDDVVVQVWDSQNIFQVINTPVFEMEVAKVSMPYELNGSYSVKQAINYSITTTNIWPTNCYATIKNTFFDGAIGNGGAFLADCLFQQVVAGSLSYIVSTNYTPRLFVTLEGCTFKDHGNAAISVRGPIEKVRVDRGMFDNNGVYTEMTPKTYFEFSALSQSFNNTIDWNPARMTKEVEITDSTFINCFPIKTLGCRKLTLRNDSVRDECVRRDGTIMDWFSPHTRDYGKNDDILDSYTIDNCAFFQDPRVIGLMSTGISGPGLQNIRNEANSPCLWQVSDSYFEVPLVEVTTYKTASMNKVLLQARNNKFNLQFAGTGVASGNFDNCYFTNAILYATGYENFIHNCTFDDSRIYVTYSASNHISIEGNSFSNSSAVTPLAVVDQGAQPVSQNNASIRFSGNRRSPTSVGAVYFKTGSAAPWGAYAEFGSVTFEDNVGIGIAPQGAGYGGWLGMEIHSDGSTLPAKRPVSFMENSTAPRIVSSTDPTWGPTNAILSIQVLGPVDGETLTLLGETRTWKTTPTDEQLHVQIGPTVTASATNLAWQLTQTNTLPGLPHIHSRAQVNTEGATTLVVGYNDQTIDFDLATAVAPVDGVVQEFYGQSGKVMTFRTTPSRSNDVLIAGTEALSMENLKIALDTTNGFSRPYYPSYYYRSGVSLIVMHGVQGLPNEVYTNSVPGVPSDGDIIIFKNVSIPNAFARKTVVYKTTPSRTNEVLIGASAMATRTNLFTLLTTTNLFDAPVPVIAKQATGVSLNWANDRLLMVSPGAGQYQSLESMWSHKRSGVFSTSGRGNAITGLYTGYGTVPGTFMDGTNMALTVFVQPGDTISHLTGAAGREPFNLINGATILGPSVIQTYNMYGTNYEVGPRFSGTGVPTHTGSIGSIYSRRDSAGGDALYVNTNGAAGWNPVVTRQYGTNGFSLYSYDATPSFQLHHSTEVATGKARGNGAVDLQFGRDHTDKVASGANSFTAGTNNTASGAYSVAMGSGNTASGSHAVAVGYGSTAQTGSATFGENSRNPTGNYSLTCGIGAQSQASYCLSVGWNSIASGAYSVALGRETLASAEASFASGSYSKATLQSQFARAYGAFTVTGDAQTSTLVARRSIQTNGVAVGTGVGITNAWNPLFLDGDAGTARMTLPYTAVTQTNAVWTFKVQIVAVATTNATPAVVNFAGGYTIEGVIKETVVAGTRTTVIVGTPVIVTLAEENAAWDVRAVADNTNEALVIEFYPENDCPRVVATITLTEVTRGL
jgi:hypothetical protein